MALTKTTSKPVTRPARPARKSRYAGIQARGSYDPYPNVGEYIFRVTQITEGGNPAKGTETVKVTLEVLESEGEHAHQKGDTVFFSERTSGAGSQQGLSRIKAFMMAAAGFEDEEQYDEFDPEGFFIEACLGAENEYSGDDRTATGRLIGCKVSRGKDTPDGSDFYRNYVWSVVDQ